MTTQPIQTVSFSFHEIYDVRVQIINAEPWFCLKDVCEVLTIANAHRVASEMLDVKGVRKAYTLTKGGQQELSYINEPNLYRVIFRSNKPEAKQFQDWVFNEVLPQIRKTGTYQNPEYQPQSPALLNDADLNNLTRLVWCISNGFKFNRAWSNGIWYALRKVTGIPSPKQFQVDQIPMLAEECRRIYAITNQFKEVIFEAEKQVIRRCLRKREEAETVISEMKQLLNAATQKDYATLNTTLAKWEEREITAFFRRDHDCMANY